MFKNVEKWPWWANAIILLAGLGGFAYVRVRGVASDAMQSLNLVGWADFDRTGVDLNGDIVAYNVRIWPFDGDRETDALRAERFIIDTQGWGWMLKSAFSFGGSSSLLKGRTSRLLARAAEQAGESSPYEDIPEMPRIHATFENIVFSEYVHSLAWSEFYVGLASGALLEAEGCGDDAFWLESELAGAMNLPNQGVNFELDINATGSDAVTVAVSLTAPGRSSWAYESRWVAPHDENAILIDWEQAQLKTERWSVADDGFVAARNAYCAARDTITEAAFLERHVQYAQRRFLASGALASAPLMETYRQYATGSGHRLVWEANPADPIALGKLYSFSAADALWMLSSHVRVDDGTAVPFKLHFVNEVPYPENEAEESPEQISAIVAAASATLGELDSPGAAPVPVNTPNPAMETMVVDGATAVIGVDGQIPSAEKPLNEDIAFDDLQHMIGERVVIKTTMNSRREGTLTSFNRAGVRLRLIDRPDMELEVPKSTVASVQVVWTKPQSAAASAAAGAN